MVRAASPSQCPDRSDSRTRPATSAKRHCRRYRGLAARGFVRSVIQQQMPEVARRHCAHGGQCTQAHERRAIAIQRDDLQVGPRHRKSQRQRRHAAHGSRPCTGDWHDPRSHTAPDRKNRSTPAAPSRPRSVSHDFCQRLVPRGALCRNFRNPPHTHLRCWSLCNRAGGLRVQLGRGDTALLHQQRVGSPGGIHMSQAHAPVRLPAATLRWERAPMQPAWCRAWSG